MDRICKNCKHWYQLPQQNSIGSCKRYPPPAVEINFPQTGFAEQCGEWEERVDFVLDYTTPPKEDKVAQCPNCKRSTDLLFNALYKTITCEVCDTVWSSRGFILPDPPKEETKTNVWHCPNCTHPQVCYEYDNGGYYEFRCGKCKYRFDLTHMPPRK